MSQPFWFIKNYQFFKYYKFSCGTYRNGLNQGTSNLRNSKYLKKKKKKKRTVLVWYFLSGIRILVCSCTGCGTSNIYLCVEDNRSFTRVSSKFETKDARP